MQKLNVQLSIDIPEEYVLITKVELEELKKAKLHGIYWTMKDLMERIKKREVWIKENILFNPNFKKILDSKNGGFVYYPERKGEHWSFQATKMAQFLDSNFHRIFD